MTKDKVMVERTELEKKLQVEIEDLKDASYAMYENGFDEAIA